MEKFIPYEKLSKKKKRELDSKRRGSWNGLNPVTRKPAKPKAYNRKKVQNRFKDYDDALSFYACLTRVSIGFFQVSSVQLFTIP